MENEQELNLIESKKMPTGERGVLVNDESLIWDLNCMLSFISLSDNFVQERYSVNMNVGGTAAW